jgi:hypothetical protein
MLFFFENILKMQNAFYLILFFAVFLQKIKEYLAANRSILNCKLKEYVICYEEIGMGGVE